MSDDTEYMSAPEVAELLGVNRKTVTRWCESGELSAWRFGDRGRWKIRKEHVQKLINHNAKKETRSWQEIATSYEPVDLSRL